MPRLLFALASLFLLFAIAISPAEKQRPNVLVILTDDMRNDATGIPAPYILPEPLVVKPGENTFEIVIERGK